MGFATLQNGHAATIRHVSLIVTRSKPVGRIMTKTPSEHKRALSLPKTPNDIRPAGQHPILRLARNPHLSHREAISEPD
jgi:hypothetical protein